MNKKVKKALEAGLTPIMCIGETLEEREGNITEKVIKTQVEGGLAGISADDVKKIVVAYEPIWLLVRVKPHLPSRHRMFMLLFVTAGVTVFSGCCRCCSYSIWCKHETVKRRRIAETADIDGG